MKWVERAVCDQHAEDEQHQNTGHGTHSTLKSRRTVSGPDRRADAAIPPWPMTVRHESADLQDTSNSFHVSHNDMAQDVAPAAMPPAIGLVCQHLAKRLIIHASRLCAFTERC
jgi:hypothetical protein